MLIETITTIGHKGDRVTFTRTADGCEVTIGGDRIAWIGPDSDLDQRIAEALAVAGAVYGVNEKGRARATNSMVYMIRSHMEDLAGC